MIDLRNIFIIGFYNIFRLCSLYLWMIILKLLLIVTLNHSWFQNCYWKYLSGNLIIAQWVPQNRLDLMRQEMQTIISSLVILHYDQFYHPKPRKVLHGTRSCVVVSSAYMQKLFIHHYYHGVTVIWRRSKI